MLFFFYGARIPLISGISGVHRDRGKRVCHWARGPGAKKEKLCWRLSNCTTNPFLIFLCVRVCCCPNGQLTKNRNQLDSNLFMWAMYQCFLLLNHNLKANNATQQNLLMFLFISFMGASLIMSRSRPYLLIFLLFSGLAEGRLSSCARVLSCSNLVLTNINLYSILYQQERVHENHTSAGENQRHTSTFMSTSALTNRHEDMAD